MLILMNDQNQKSLRVNLKLKYKKRFRTTMSNSRVLLMWVLMKREPEVTESKFKTEVEEKVQNNNVKLESFTDVDIDERTESEVTE